ncbi:MAG: hypothetical protein HKN93_03255 [Acidimicrobiia bacterium]|nr:hypothetical protein [Acidimicrobiia bacterium]
MRRVLVRYKTKPEAADRNQELVEAVFAELAETRPDGLKYGTVRLEDGVTFVHVAFIEGDENPLGQSPAFAAFQAGIAERCDEPPQAQAATVVGSYGVFG